MTQHSIEELKRQLDAALSKRNLAEVGVRKARARYDSARLAATGFKDCVAEFDDYRGNPVRFLVEGFGWWDSIIKGPMIRVDGSIGEMRKQCEISKARNLGPYKSAVSP